MAPTHQDHNHPGSGQATRPQTLDDLPIHLPSAIVNSGPHQFGQSSKPKIDRSCRVWLSVKNEKQDRCHSDTAANTRQTNHKAGQSTRSIVSKVNHIAKFNRINETDAAMKPGLSKSGLP